MTVNLFRKIRTPDKTMERVQDGVSNLAQQVIQVLNGYRKSFTTAALTATTATIETLTATASTLATLTATTATITSAVITELRHPVTAAITSGGVNVNVDGVNVLFADTSGGSFTITNFTGGSNGQIVWVVKITASGNLSFSHNDNSSGGQRIYTVAGGTLTITGSHGGVGFIFREGNWYQISDYT